MPGYLGGMWDLPILLLSQLSWCQLVSLGPSHVLHPVLADILVSGFEKLSEMK